MRRPLLTAAALLLTAAAAAAHTGPGTHGAETAAFVSGLLHPLLGTDHLLAMIGVGLLAGLTGGRALWALPASFILAMAVGGGLGFGGAALPMVEPAILASVVLLGAAVAAAVRLPLAPACAAIALFGLFHGNAHGLEGPALGGLRYAAGFLVATAALHGAGLALAAPGSSRLRPGPGRRITRGITRGLGGATAAAGLALAFA